jgi:hypothetical protein
MLQGFAGKYKKGLLNPMRKWGGDIEIKLQQILQKGLDWIYPTLDRDQCQVFVDTIMHLQALHTLWEIL